MSIYIIGITGQSGAGKSYFSDILRRRGIPCIDADGVYHTLLTPDGDCTKALREVFGEGVVAPDGSLDRKALGAIVFSDPDKLTLLNQTVLPIVLCHIRTMIQKEEAKGTRTIAVDAPTLIESGFDRECDLVVSVTASRKKRIERIMRRDGISSEAAAARVDAQPSEDFYAEHSHYVLDNGERAALFETDALSLLDTLKL